jgi:hypothetical protein
MEKCYSSAVYLITLSNFSQNRIHSAPLPPLLMSHLQTQLKKDLILIHFSQLEEEGPGPALDRKQA